MRFSPWNITSVMMMQENLEMAAGGHAEFHGEVDYGDNLAAQVGDAADPDRSVGNGGDSLVLNDLPDLHDRDGIFLACS